MNAELARALDRSVPLNAFKTVAGFREANICFEREKKTKKRRLLTIYEPVRECEFRFRRNDRLTKATMKRCLCADPTWPDDKRGTNEGLGTKRGTTVRFLRVLTGA